MRNLSRTTALALTLAMFSVPQGEAQLAGDVLAVQGAILIDGNGGAPVANVNVVIQGNQILAVGPAAQVPVPAGAQVINATGKYVLPGLWDAQTNYASFWGELFLSQGVTSQIDIGLGGEVSIAERDAVNKGLSRGPRQWVGVAHFGGVNAEDITGYETPFDGRQLPKTLEEAQRLTMAWLDAGADMLMWHSGQWDPAWVKWGCDEAHKRNKPCFQRPSGPRMRPADAAMAGAEVFHHSQGIAQAVMKDGTMTNNELERYAAMDEAKARALIQVLVQNKVYLVPNVIHNAPGYPRDWPRMQTEFQRVFSGPNLLAYYDKGFLAEVTSTRTNVDQGAVRERRMPGYLNNIRFHKMYLEAGGKVLIGGDTNGGKAPGLIVHEEMEIFQEGGIARMAIIQGATKWAAEAMRVADRIGTVERGKLADLIVVNANPLTDVANLRNIDTVIQNGKVVDRNFHADYRPAFYGASTDQRYTINDGKWVRALKREMLANGGGANAPNPPESPQPAIEAIAPTRVTEGAGVTTLTLKGFNFVARSRVLYDGVQVPYRRVSATELQITLDPSLLQKAGRHPIVVVNPEPVEAPQWGNGTSNNAYLIVANK